MHGAKTGVLVVLRGAFRSLAACSIYGNSTGIRCWRLRSLGCQTIVEWSKRHLALTEHAGSCSLKQNREEREREKEVLEASSVGEKSARALHSSRSLGRVTGPFNNRTTVLITARVGLLYYLRPWIPELRLLTRHRDRAFFACFWQTYKYNTNYMYGTFCQRVKITIFQAKEENITSLLASRGKFPPNFSFHF